MNRYFIACYFLALACLYLVTGLVCQQLMAWLVTPYIPVPSPSIWQALLIFWLLQMLTGARYLRKREANYEIQDVISDMAARLMFLGAALLYGWILKEWWLA